jgi:hypothetical protein
MMANNRKGFLIAQHFPYSNNHSPIFCLKETQYKEEASTYRTSANTGLRVNTS